MEVLFGEALKIPAFILDVENTIGELALEEEIKAKLESHLESIGNHRN